MRSRLHRLLSRCFRLEEINGAQRCPTYLYRWTLARFFGVGVYLHHFVADDWARDMHDHPKRFISIGLWGKYCEETPAGERVFRAPWVRSFPASHIHRLSLIDARPCWTLVIVLKRSKPWGFWTSRGWVPWKQYVGGDLARKNCP